MNIVTFIICVCHLKQETHPQFQGADQYQECQKASQYSFYFQGDGPTGGQEKPATYAICRTN